MKQHWDILILIFLICVYAITFSVLSSLRHDAFASGYDLANMGQTAWNVLNGRGFTLSAEESVVSRFSIHADLILILLSPLYIIWSRVKILLVAQSVIIALGAIPVYYLSKTVLKDKATDASWKIKLVSLIITIAFLLNPGMQWTNMYDFHGISLAISFLLAAFYFAYQAVLTSKTSPTEPTTRWYCYWFFIVLTLLTKEEISLYVAMLGLIITFIFKERKLGLSTFFIGISWFAVMIFLVIPYYSADGKYWALDWIKLSNDSLRDQSVFSITHTIYYKFFVSPDVLTYYVALLKPFSFLPILGFPWLILSLPELSINILSSQAQMRSVYFHYDSGLVPSLVIATIFGLKYLKYFIGKIKPLAKYSSVGIYLAAAFLLAGSLRTNYHYSPLPTTPSCWCIIYQVSDEDRAFQRVLEKIPQDATVTSSSEIRAHLIRRENSFNLPSATISAQYIAIIDQNRIVGDYNPKTYELELLKTLNKTGTHDLMSHIGHFYLFKKK